MQSCNYSFSELEASVQMIESIEAKIEFISEKVMGCHQYLLNMRHAVNSIKIAEVEIRTDYPNLEFVLNDLLRKDETLRNQIVLEKVCLLKEKLCESAVMFIEQAKMLLEHHQRSFEIRIKSNVFKESIMNIDAVAPEIPRIIWIGTEIQLLRLFRELNSNEIIPAYTKAEILGHFMNERLIPFCKQCTTQNKFLWKDSDSSFAVFVNELAKMGLIGYENKFKNFSAHFVNRNGEQFKNLAQKRNYKDLSLDTGSFIREILSFLKKG